MLPKVTTSIDELPPISEINLSQSNEILSKIFNLPNGSFNASKLISNATFKELITLVGYKYHTDRLKKTILHVSDVFASANTNWKPRYNLIFFNILHHFRLLNRANVTEWFFGTNDFTQLNEDDQKLCDSLIIYSKIIHTSINEIVKSPIDNSKFAITVYFGILENIGHLLKLFFENFDLKIKEEIFLNEYRKFRNSIAHSSFIYDENDKLIFIDFKPPKQSSIIKKWEILDGNVDEITNELKLLTVILLQVIELYQLVHQTMRK